ncbi:MAG: sulfatase [Deltaproteobacteria bacterium]|nr:sulfatase [Deltaproteobacteria bacterium]
MNLIIVTIDSLRKDYMGCYGNPWIRTPNMDRFFERAIVFDRLRMNGIPTIPFRRGLMLGRRIFPFKDAMKVGSAPLGWQPMKEEEITLQDVLQQAGYVTAMVTDVYHYFRPGMNFHKGFDSWQLIRGHEGDPYVTEPSRQDPDEKMDPALRGRRMQNLFEQYVRNADTIRYEEDCFAPRVFRTAEKWLQKNARHYENFFLYIDCFDPHEPWDPPKEYVSLYDPGYRGMEYIFPQNGPCDHLSKEEIKHIQALYAGKVSLVDRWFGHFMEKFFLMGLEKDTLVLFLSDHGLQLGDHGLMKKLSKGMFTELLEVPMMLLVPGSSHKRVQGFVQEEDIAPTLLKLLGLQAPPSMTGLDLWPMVSGEKKVLRDHVVGGFHTWAYVQDDQYHYFRNLVDDPKAYLFDLQKDVPMLDNLSDKEPGARDRMEKKLQAGLEGWLPPRELLGTRIYDLPYVPFRLRSEPGL